MKTKETQKKVSLYILLALLCAGLFAAALFAKPTVLKTHAQTDSLYQSIEENLETGESEINTLSQNLEGIGGDEFPFDTYPFYYHSTPLYGSGPDWYWESGYNGWYDPYGYALGVKSIIPPLGSTPLGNWPGKLLGKSFANTLGDSGFWTTEKSNKMLDKLANLVKNDLIFLGKSVTGISRMSIESLDALDSSDKHIAIRVGNSENYHFMRYDSSQSYYWTHRPYNLHSPFSSWSAVLKYQSPSNFNGLFDLDNSEHNNKHWVNEVYYRKDNDELEYFIGTQEYYSDIYFVSYRDDLWQTNSSGTTITGANIQLNGTFQLPSTIINSNGVLVDSAITAIENLGLHPDLKEIVIPKNITYISPNAFNGCSNLEKITVDSANPNYFSENGILYDKQNNKRGNTLIRVPAKAISGSFTIPSGIIGIAENAFMDNSSLTSLVIPLTVTTIGSNAFHNNTYVTWQGNIEFKAGQLIKFIGNQSSYVIPNNITSISPNAFEWCGLESIIIPSGVTSIGSKAFYYCTGLQSIVIPNSVTHIGEYAFERCTKLTNLIIPDSVMSIGFSAFGENVFQTV